MNRRDVVIGAAATSVLGTSLAATERVIQRRIPSSGETIPVIGLGTSGPFEVGSHPSERTSLTSVLEAFFEGGGSVIDTSPMYTTAEGVLGDLLTPPMQKAAFVATKVWADGEQAGADQVGRSMQLLKRERLDLVQVHNLRDLNVHLRTLRKLKDAGKIRYVGITHFTVSAHADLVDVIRREKLDFVQFNYSASAREAEQRLLPLAQEREVGVIVNRAFDDGKIFERVGKTPVPAWAAEFDCDSWAQMFLKYVIAHEAVTCVIPATGRVRNVRDNLAAGRGRLPDAAQRKRIVDLLATL